MNKKSKYRYPFVNQRQTKEERRKKYHRLRKAGFSSYLAQQFRDFANIDRIIAETKEINAFLNKKTYYKAKDGTPYKSRKSNPKNT